MTKPRIVIADADIHYLIPLQQKFLEAYYSQVDIEVISDSGFLEQFLSIPQKIDILIVSEAFCTANLQRHIVGHTFVLTEQNTAPQANALGQLQIYKYSSVREIFRIITGQCQSVLNALSGEEKKSEIVLVCSAAGGVGKTTVALGLCACLKKRLQRVLYINAAHLQSFQTLLKSPASLSVTDLMQASTAGRWSDYALIKSLLHTEGFSYLPPFRDALISMGIPYAVFGTFAASARASGEFDVIIVDADASIDDDKARLIDLADKVIIVTEQRKASVCATNILVSCINTNDQDKFLFVGNGAEAEELPEQELHAKYSVCESVPHISDYDQLTADDLAEIPALQRIAYLVI